MQAFSTTDRLASQEHKCARHSDHWQPAGSGVAGLHDSGTYSNTYKLMHANKAVSHLPTLLMMRAASPLPYTTALGGTGARYAAGSPLRPPRRCRHTNLHNSKARTDIADHPQLQHYTTRSLICECWLPNLRLTLPVSVYGSTPAHPQSCTSHCCCRCMLGVSTGGCAGGKQNCIPPERCEPDRTL